MASNMTPVGREEHKKLTTLVQSLYDNNDAEMFRTPVDAKGLGLKDYNDIIKTPMDLGTIRKNLKANKYKNIEDMLADVQLVWDNCKEYNAEGSWIWNVADKLEKYSQKMIKNHLPNQTLSKSRLSDSGAEDRMDESGLDIEEENTVSSQAKMNLIQKVKGLSQEALGHIVKVIQEECPNAWKEVEKDKYQIVVDNIKKDTFQKIEGYVIEYTEEPVDQVTKKVKVSK